MSANEKSVSVSAFLTQRIDNSDKSEREIAEEVGYKNLDVFTSLKQGLIKIPINKINPIANALGIDSAHFLRLVMREYMPETLDALEEIWGGSVLTRNEREMLTYYRRVTGDTDPPAVMLGGIVALLSPSEFRR